jgi:hypothetical protein
MSKRRKKNRTILVVLFLHPSFTFFRFRQCFLYVILLCSFFFQMTCVSSFHFVGFFWFFFFSRFYPFAVLCVIGETRIRTLVWSNHSLTGPPPTIALLRTPIAQSDHLYAQYSSQPLRACFVTMVFEIMVIL